MDFDFFVSHDGQQIARHGDARTTLPEVWHPRKARWIPSPGLDLVREFAEVSREDAASIVGSDADLD